MSELKRPASIRELLECLPRLTLVNLCEARGLPVARANYDCRSSLARSFRGQRDDFLAALRKDDLALLLMHPIRDGEELFELSDADEYTRRELLELAITGFGRTRELGRPFSLCVQATTHSDLPPAPPAPDAVAVVEEDPLLVPESSPSLSHGPSSGWSRPRQVKLLLAHMGMPIHSDLTQDDFSGLVEALENRGYEVATIAGERLTPLHDTVGLDAEVRLRHDALAIPAAFMRAGAAGQGELTSRGSAVLGDYERASLRLELLTAGFGGDASDQLVADCVEIAATGLPLDGTARGLLERVARKLVRTRREPIAVLSGLLHRLETEDGEVLLREYGTLHRPGEEMSELLFAHWAALSGAGAATHGATERPAAVVGIGEA